MEYCGPRGIPHSEFLSWDPTDQDKALTWLISKREKCPRCGSVTDDWIDERGRMREDPPWKVKTRRCLGCEVLKDAKKEIPEEDRDSVEAYLVKARGKPKV